jgi:hypothetical protein
MNNKKKHGQYFTKRNPFKGSLWKRWCLRLPHKNVVEPFAGASDITNALKSFTWSKFDIEPQSNDVVFNDSISNFPQGFDICITNPPYLAKNSATRMGLEYDTHFDDLYLASLDSALENVDYLAAIIPASFVTSGMFKDRLLGIDIITDKMFDDTDVPVCVAYFVPDWPSKIDIYKNGLKMTVLEEFEIPQNNALSCEFNSTDGNLGLHAIDGTTGGRIRFVPAIEITREVKGSDRSITKIKVSTKITNTFIKSLNDSLETYRKESCDLTLTPFRGLQANGEYRKRLSYKIAKQLINGVEL